MGVSLVFVPPWAISIVVALQIPVVIVPTLVKLEFKIVEFKVVPDNVPASAIAVIEISALPSNATPLIFLAVANFVEVLEVPALVAYVAVAALPVVDWFHVGIVPDKEV